MKILQVMAGASVGGAEGFFIDAVWALKETNLAQQALIRGNSQSRQDALAELGITYKTASFNKHFYCATDQKLQKTIKEFSPDIVHYWLGRAGSFAVKGSHINIGWYGAYYHPKYYQNCQHHVAVTQDVADHIISHGIPAKNVHVLHIYAECHKAKPVNRAEFNTPEDAPLLLSLARLHPVKGLDVLLNALVKIPEAYLWLAGSGPLEQELKEQAKQLGLESRVKFLGWRDDREALLAAADICVFPSRNDSFGAVILEAWATETPFIATKAPGPKAYVKHDDNGLLVEVDDTEGLAQAIKRVIDDTDLKQHLITNGLKAYKSGFTKEAFKDNITDLYQKVLR